MTVLFAILIFSVLIFVDLDAGELGGNKMAQLVNEDQDTENENRK